MGGGNSTLTRGFVTNRQERRFIVSFTLELNDDTDHRTIQPIPTIHLGIAILAMLWPVWSDISGGAISQLGNYVPTGEERRGEEGSRMANI